MNCLDVSPQEPSFEPCTMQLNDGPEHRTFRSPRLAPSCTLVLPPALDHPKEPPFISFGWRTILKACSSAFDRKSALDTGQPPSFFLACDSSAAASSALRFSPFPMVSSRPGMRLRWIFAERPACGS